MTRTFRAPGRVNLIGEHTDYSGGLVLPAAIDRYLTVAGEPAKGGITLVSDAVPGAAAVAADGSDAADARGWARYVGAVAAELAALGRPAVGFSGEVTSDLPRGAGLSSSAALEVAVALALCAIADLAVEPLELAEACRRAEQRAVGVPCGIMDQAVSLLGRGGHALLLDCGTLGHTLVPLPADLALVVIDSGVSRRLEVSAYAERRRELERGLAGGTDPVAARRVRHVVAENERVRRVVHLLTRPGPLDREELGRLFAEGHASLRDDFEVSTAELDLLVELAREAGAVAARMTGAGFGGAIVALADDDAAPALAHAVLERYAWKTGRQGTFHVCTPADGAHEVL